MRVTLCIITAILFGFLQTLQGQHNDNPAVQEVFLPYDTGQETHLRTATGAPGRAYWQNTANYDINVRLNPEKHKIKGSVSIHYINNSPHALSFVWLKLAQNLFKKDSWGRQSSSQQLSDVPGGFNLDQIEVQQHDNAYAPEHHIVDTNVKLNLQQPIRASGGEVTITVDYSFTVPVDGADRMGRTETEQGVIYQIAQWYPRMAVYDGVSGWNTLPYLGTGEFYMDYGTFAYSITVPSDYIVAGSGTLQNPDEVLTDTQQERLKKARRSDQPVSIIRKEEVKKGLGRPQEQDQRTWTFRMDRARDVAWGASKAFMWDAARINLPDEQQALAMSFYPVESAADTSWGRSTEYLKATIEFYSDYLAPYPYSTAINVAGPQALEYPGLAFNYAGHGQLWYLTNHEIGHNWFPMLVGSNERTDAWMDEGLNTFMDYLSASHFNNGEFNDPKTHPSIRLYHDRRWLTRFLTSDMTEPIMTPHDQMETSPPNDKVYGYAKPALGLHILREFVIGKELFDEALKEYVDRWSYKHPTPNDFFNTMEDVTGRHLDWFWRGWFEKTWTLDQAVDSVHYVNGDPSEGSLIHISNKNKLVMPVKVKIKQKNGATDTIRRPVHIWHHGDTFTIEYNSTSELESVMADPEKELPDVQPDNNRWSGNADK